MKLKFVNQLNASFGSGGMSTALDNNSLIEYFQYLQRSFDGQMPIKKGVVFPGFHDGDICVLSETTFISASGELLDPSTADLVWLNRDIVHENSKIRSSDITPNIVTPLCLEPLHDLFKICRKISKHNFIPTLLMISGGIQCFHFQKIVDMYGCCPIPVAHGEAETGKSTALKAALSLYPCDEIGLCVKGSNSILLERACSTGMCTFNLDSIHIYTQIPGTFTVS